MQGGWLGATAIGNQLLFIGAVLYESIPIWLTWTVFVVACSLSMITMFIMLKWLERVAKKTTQINIKSEVTLILGGLIFF
jgi:POT family proton-dependent oligopeptide transporter